MGKGSLKKLNKFDPGLVWTLSKYFNMQINKFFICGKTEKTE